MVKDEFSKVEKTYEVVGFSGCQSGDVDSLTPRFPIVQDSDGLIFTVGDFWFSDPPGYPEAKDTLGLDEISVEFEKPILRGQIVSEVGPAFLKRMAILNPELWGILFNDFFDTYDGFKAKIMSLSEYEIRVNVVLALALEAFNLEMPEGRGALNERAKDALEVFMRFLTDVTPFSAAQIRYLRHAESVAPDQVIAGISLRDWVISYEDKDRFDTSVVVSLENIDLQ